MKLRKYSTKKAREEMVSKEASEELVLNIGLFKIMVIQLKHLETSRNKLFKIANCYHLMNLKKLTKYSVQDKIFIAQLR